ncbi:MAG: dihydrodipicolinate synthase family protein [Eubacteriales bacterium]|nr:dihydrodipicolinate synthase family protein [Eubacteriales bacterium]
MVKIFQGIISEPMISYHPDQTIDFETTGKIFRNLALRGAGGLFVNGFGDECYSLSLQERLDVAKCALDAVKGTKCLVIGVALTTCLRDALWLIPEYEKLGVHAISITPPPFYELTDEAMHRYLSSELAVTKLPVMVFNCREMNELVSPRMLGRLAREFPNLKGYKDATRNPVHLTQCIDELDGRMDDFCVISGCDATFYMHLCLGATATVSFMSVPFFDQMKAIYDRFMAGDREGSWQAQRTVLKLRAFMQKYPDSAAYIYGMKYTAGIDVRGTRHPQEMLDIPQEGKAAFDQLVKELGISAAR